MGVVNKLDRSRAKYRMQYINLYSVDKILGTVGADALIAKEQAAIPGLALGNVKIDIVGGKGDYFRKFISALGTGYTIDGIIDKCQALQLGPESQL